MQQIEIAPDDRRRCVVAGGGGGDAKAAAAAATADGERRTDLPVAKTLSEVEHDFANLVLQ